MAKDIKAYVTTPDYSQVVDKTDAKTHPGLIQCRRCSKPGHQVFHNKGGARRHVTEKELKKIGA
jgi:hypothetical protein